MREKRREAQRRAAQTKANAQAKANSEANAKANVEAKSRAAEVAASQQEVIPWLRALGCNAETARRAAARCTHIPDAPLEERVKVAVQGLAPACVRRAAPVASSPA